jgi:hypothetical protein
MLKIKLFGLSEIDASSLKSMLSLANDLLRNDWKIVESDDMDLAVYSFDSAEGVTAWENRGEGLTALLTKSGNITEPVDIVIKKPLRTSNFSDALNLIAEKVNPVESEKTNNTELTDTPLKNKANPKSSVFKNISKGINKYLPVKPARKQADVIVDLPELDPSSKTIVDDIESLGDWLNNIAKIHNKDSVNALLEKLAPLNRLEMPETKRIDFMIAFSDTIFEIFANRELTVERRTESELKQEAELINASLMLLEELNHGFKRVVNECVNKNEKITSNPLFLYASVKVAEVTGMLLLFCYQHYRSQPNHHFEQLHKLYLFCEQAGVVDSLPNYKNNRLDCSFSQLYKQVILISISDPYNLERFEASRLFNLLKKLAAHAEIKVMTKNQIEVSSDFFMIGHFCIDIDSDAIPKAMNKTPVETRKKATSRLLNIQPVLLKLEKIFKQTATTSFGGSFDLDIRLLKKITPQLNTTYERRYQRVDTNSLTTVQLVQGISNIHDSIREKHLNHATEWYLKNKSGAGLMLTRDAANRPGLYIGDIVALFEDEKPVQLLIVRWLQVDHNNMINIGVQLIMGKPLHVVCTPANESKMYPALLIPQDEHNAQKVLLTDKGIFTPNRTVRISGDKEPYTATLKTLLDSSYYFEKFDYKVSLTS